jgi:hypothetical protein
VCGGQPLPLVMAAMVLLLLGGAPTIVALVLGLQQHKESGDGVTTGCAKGDETETTCVPHMVCAELIATKVSQTSISWTDILNPCFPIILFNTCAEHFINFADLKGCHKCFFNFFGSKGKIMLKF